MGVTWAWAPLLLAAALPAAPANVLVVAESGVEAYAEALEGIDSVLGGNRYTRFDLRQDGADLGRALAAPDLRVVIAVGSRAVADVSVRQPNVPVIGSMVLHGADQEGGPHVDLDVPLSAQLSAIRAIWPRHSRVAIIRNPARSRYSAEALESQAHKEGFVAVVVDCDGPARLLKAVAQVKGKADFLLCFPDPDLYNAVTIKPFVLASLEARIPVVGFSPAFVRAGAAAGIFPDYREIGRQAAEAALERLRGGDGSPGESPRKVRVAVNQRVARLLGIEFRTDSRTEVFR
jgi:ABC-type uncharacterized transport system substrate-binding protein